MSMAFQRADARASVREAARADALERRLDRFQLQVRPRIRALAARHPRLKDLALSFPALLFALAVPRPGHDPARAIAAVIEGARLREAGALAGVPLWLRRYGPEAYRRPLPALPDGELFRRQIGNHAPRSLRAVDGWLDAVARAYAYCDDAVALWVAREWARAKASTRNPHLLRTNLRCVCLWAWYGRHDAGAVLGQPTMRWTPSMTWPNAVRAAYDWHSSLMLFLWLGNADLDDVWLTAGEFEGYEFVPLRNAADVAEEARVMENCARTYGNRLANGGCRLWSVRRDGQPFATLEVAYRYENPLPMVAQLRLAKNAPAPLDVWWVAGRWLASHDLRRLARADRRTPAVDHRRWQAQWRPYWLAKRRIPNWLPLVPEVHHMHAL